MTYKIALAAMSSVFVALVLFGAADAMGLSAYSIHIPAIMQDMPRMVHALGPCPSPLECIQTAYP